MKYALLLLLVMITMAGLAQQQNDKDQQPLINYTLIINDSDLTSYQVQMHISHVPDTFRLAMVKHFEYDDRFRRFIKDFTVQGKNGTAQITRQDSALWKIITTGNEAAVSYRIQPPVNNGQHGSWIPFLASNGALAGGPQSFMYIVGHTKIPSQVTVQLPAGWAVATGLPAKDAHTFYASSVYTLIDEPILAGKLKIWMFTVNGVPHKIAYYPLPGATPFDTTALVSGIQKTVKQAAQLFGSLPYKDYTFQLIDGSYGGLEHKNSVTLGAASTELAKGFTGFFYEMAHEYFHTWNLVRIRPAAYGDVTYAETPPSKELWWSEGMTMFYADLLLRRAGLPVAEPNRMEHLEQLMSRYFSESGNTKISPEQVSMAANAPPGVLGDYTASTHLQGELLGTMLDLIIRNATGNKRSVDDVMRGMMQRFGHGKGFTNIDIERMVHTTCGCNMHDFFAEYIYGNHTIDFNRYLQPAGLYSTITWKDAAGDDGRLLPDLRIYAWLNKQGKLVTGITDPKSIWGKAGVHTGDEIVTVNNTPVITQRDFFSLLRKAKTGDTVAIELKRQAGIYKVNVTVSGYKTAIVKIEKLITATQAQHALRKQWLEGN
jgi:predicted metalloprotease with PDZ domain